MRASPAGRAGLLEKLAERELGIETTDGFELV